MLDYQRAKKGHLHKRYKRLPLTIGDIEPKNWSDKLTPFDPYHSISILWHGHTGHTWSYSGWKKSSTTLDGWNSMNNGINHLSTGAGFLPSTVPPSIVLNLDSVTSVGFTKHWVNRASTAISRTCTGAMVDVEDDITTGTIEWGYMNGAWDYICYQAIICYNITLEHIFEHYIILPTQELHSIPLFTIISPMQIGSWGINGNFHAENDDDPS